MRYVDRERRPDALPAGSGTLVSVGGAFGLLTARHVLEELPSSGPVGIVRFLRPTQENPHLDLRQTERISFGKDEPDVGFLLFPEGVVKALKARNTFVDLLSRRTEFVEGRKTEPYYLCLAGVIAERTQELPATSRFPVGRGIKAALTGVEVGEEYGSEEGIVHVRPMVPASERPGTYAGTSGGGLWRCYVERDLQRAKGAAVVGVAFGESSDRSVISCVGPRPIYGEPVDRIQNRWPNARR